MLSYWEQQSFTKYDFIIIGSGIVGMSTAIELKQRFPEKSVLVLERGLLPTGATTRNAGFACMGSATELLDDLKTRNEADVVGLFAQRKKGLDKLRERFGDDTLGYKSDGGYELIGNKGMHVFKKLDYLNALLYSVLGKNAFDRRDDKIDVFGFNKDYVKGLIQNNCEAGLNSGKLMQALLKMAGQLGVEIKTGAEVSRFEDGTSYVSIFLNNPHRTEELVLNANQLIICTNAFTKKLLPDEDVIPGRGQVLITEPIKDLKLKGVYHFDEGYYYFREIDGRVLFGGGRNLDFEGETTTNMSLSGNIQADLEQKLKEIILPDTPFTIAQRWAGIMAFGEHKGPIIKSFSPRVFGAFRMGGMGVALGTETASQVVNLIAESA